MTAAVSPPRQRPRPVPSRAKPLARLAVAGVAGYVAIDILLAFLRPGYSLIYNAESDYGRGPWSWVMDLNFVLRCALSSGSRREDSGLQAEAETPLHLPGNVSGIR